MKTAKAHRKFAIYSIYLDTWLEGEEEILEGETRKDTLKRIAKELEETAAELRQEYASMRGETISAARESSPPIGPSAPMVIDLSAIREKEALEDQIIAAQTKDQLTSIKDACEKAGLVSQYIKRFNELNNADSK